MYDARKSIARHVMSVFGGMPKARQFAHDDAARTLELLSVAESPDEGVISYSTAGLCEVPFGAGTRIELCGAMPDDVRHWPDILAAAAFALAASGQPVHPGMVLRDAVARFYPKTRVPHLYLSIPFMWNEGVFPSLSAGDTPIHWLQGFPISEDEARLVGELGDDAFESRLEQADVDIFDLNRPSI